MFYRLFGARFEKDDWRMITTSYISSKPTRNKFTDLTVDDMSSDDDESNDSDEEDDESYGSDYDGASDVSLGGSLDSDQDSGISKKFDSDEDSIDRIIRLSRKARTRAGPTQG